MRQLINIGSKNLEVSVTGEGYPVVIMTGLASFIDEWEAVTNELSAYGKVIIFHRSGYGNSQLNEDKRNTLATARDLNLLLDKLNINNPVILVGHSYGGFCAQRFAMEFPEKVHSLVLVESNSMDFHLLEEVLGPQTAQWSTMYRNLAKMNGEELKNKLNPQILPHQQNLSKESKEHILKFKVNPNMYHAMADEMEEMSKCAQKIKEYGKPLNMPLLVIGREPEYSIEMMMNQGMPKQLAEKVEDTWQDLIKKQLELSEKNRYILAKHSGHGVYVDSPNVIVTAITSLLD